MSALVAAGFLSLGCAGSEERPDPSPETVHSAVADSPLPPPATLRAHEVATFDPTPFLGQDWYGLYLHGEKVGYVTITVTRREDSGPPTIVCEEIGSLQVLNLGQPVKGRVESRSVYAANGNQGLLEKRYFLGSGGKSTEHIGVIEADQFVVRTLRGTEEHSRKSCPLPKETLGDHLAAQVLARSGSVPGTKQVTFGFDLGDGRESKVSYEVAGTEEGFAEGVASRIVLIRQGDSKDKPMRLSSAGKYLEMERAGSLTIRMEPEEVAKDIRHSTDLFLRGLLRVDRKLGPPQSVRTLHLRLKGTDRTLVLPSGGHQIVMREEDGALRITLRSEVPRDLLPVVSEKESAQFLRPTPEVPLDNEAIRKLAVEAAGGTSTPEEKVRRFVRFVEEYIEDTIRLESASVLDVLRDRRGDCSEHTDLFLALCRASGVPARAVSGFMYAGDSIGGFASHRWAEVAIDGRWMSADPTWGEFPVDATHIAREFGGDTTNTLKMLSGSINVEVVSLETAKGR